MKAEDIIFLIAKLNAKAADEFDLFPVAWSANFCGFVAVITFLDQMIWNSDDCEFDDLKLFEEFLIDEAKKIIAFATSAVGGSKYVN